MSAEGRGIEGNVAFLGKIGSIYRNPGTRSAESAYFSRFTKWEIEMFMKSVIVGAAVLLSTAVLAQNAQSSGASNLAPGQQMHDAKKSTAPGASEYAPGQKMQGAKKSTGPGASEYAPGQQPRTTGTGKTNR